MQRSINTIIFDFGGVLIYWNPKNLYRKIFQNEEEIAYFLKHVCTPEWNQQMDRGRPFEEAIEELVYLFPAYKDEIQYYHTRWIEMIAGPVEGTHKTLQELKDAGHRLYGLTNWSAETLPPVMKKYKFFSLFEGIVVSGEEKLVKPDHRIYHVLANRYDIQPKNSIFIDDNIENIETASTLGFHTIHFQSDQQLRLYLNELKVL